MTPRFLPLALVLLLPVLLAACGGESAPAAPATSTAPATPAAPATPTAPATPGSTLLLPQDLPAALPVLEALAGAEGQEIAVVGKLQSKVKGRAIFHLVDDSVPDCLRCGMPDSCKTPWDYCCKVKEMKASILLVELRGADGKPLRVEPLGLRELDLVAVKGTLTKGEGGRLMLLAKDGWFLRDRPKVLSSIKFPD